ncbi:MAG: GspE/PulE family protein [Parcubacteria group bacterium]
MLQYSNNQYVLNLLRQQGVLRDREVLELQDILNRQGEKVDLARILVNGGFVSLEKMAELDLQFKGKNLIDQIPHQRENDILDAESKIEFEEAPDEEPETDIINAADKEDKISRVVSMIIERAIASRASDIHVDSNLNSLIVRFRVDGMLQNVLSLPLDFSDEIMFHLKKMGGSESGGRFKFAGNGKTYHLIASFIPTINGEKATLRFVQHEKHGPDLAQLGFDGNHLDKIIEAIGRKSGLTIVAGPAGSGKSTTMFSLLNAMNKEHLHAATLENPIEYRLPGASHVHVHPENGFGYADGLRAILRHDPDIILIGEIKDNETAEAAIHAALSGRQVLSAANAPDAAGAIYFLLRMKVEPHLLASVLNLVIAQRLCRRICSNCKTDYELNDEMFGSWSAHSNLKAYKGGGCDACSNTGYLGKIVVAEVLPIDSKIRSLIANGSVEDELSAMNGLAHDAIAKASAGVISWEEALNVI